MRGIFLGAMVLIATFSLRATAEDVPAADATRTAADEARRARVFATVGKTQITVGELEDSINARSPYARKRFEDPEIVREFADDRVKTEIFEQGAENLGYSNDPAVVTFLDKAILQLFMRQEIEQAEQAAAISEEQVVAYYNDHPDDFRRPEMRRASHVLVGSREEAKAIIDELEAGSHKTLGKIAKERSLDTETRLRGGDLLYFTEDGTTVGSADDAAVDAALVKAAFALERKGDITPKPVDVGDEKWSVVQLTAIRPARVESLADASKGIQRRLWREDRKAALDELLSDLRMELQPEVHPERVDAIVLQNTADPIEPPNQ